MPVRFYTSGPITPDRAQFIVKDLEPGVYDIRSSPELGMFIIRVPDFVLPSKLYGSIEERAARVLNTFKHVRQMGVACFGLKGSGKTLLAKKIALDSGLPVITLNTDFPPNMVESMLETMGPHVLFIDEFEKVFNEDEKQDAFLTVLDGTSQARRLTIITANDEKKIRDPFIRRPGRIHYLFTYSGLTDEEVKTYLDDKLSPDVPAEYRTMIEERAQALAENLNFDILRAMVFEVNLYFNNIPAAKILGGLNVQPPPRTEEWKIIGEWSDPTFDLIVVPGTTVYVESGETALEAFEDIYPFPIMVKNKPKKSIDDDDDDLIVPSVSGGDMDAGKSLYSTHRTNYITLQLRRAEIVAASPKKYTFEYEVIKDGQLQHSALRRVGCAEFISNFYTTLGDSLPRNLSVRFIATRQPERQGFRWSHAF